MIWSPDAEAHCCPADTGAGGADEGKGWFARVLMMSCGWLDHAITQ